VSDPSCIFCKIVAGDAPADVVNRTDGFLAIRDIAPKADTHLLVMPEQHLESFREVGALSADESKRMLEFTAETARQAGLDEYRVMTFIGPSAGQTVFHLHWHLLGGVLRELPV
jgi:histidine triad (HIT) family protein